MESSGGVYKRSDTSNPMAEAMEMSTVTVDSGLESNGKSNGSYDLSPADDKTEESTGISKWIERAEKKITDTLSKQKKRLTILFRVALLVAYIVYFIYCMQYSFGDEGSILLCVATGILFTTIVYKFYKSRQSGKKSKEGPGLCPKIELSPKLRLYTRYALYVVAVVGLTAYLSLVVLRENPDNVQSLLGVLGIPFMCVFLSSKPSKINWHPVFWGLVMQLVFATITIQTEAGYRTLAYLGDSIETILGFSDVGGAFVLGRDFKSMGLAFTAASAVIFFGSLMGLLTHWGIVDFVVTKAGTALSAALETGPVESVIAVANIFIGLDQAPLLVRPYLPTMSSSELNAMMTCGFASVSGTILALFIAFGAPANHLLTACFISAPAALATAKILVPETETVDSETQQAGLANNPGATSGGSQNALGSASDGAMISVTMVSNAMANMLAFVSLMALMDAILIWLGNCAGYDGLTFSILCGYVLYPIAFAMGVPAVDCVKVGSLIGIKLFATPMVAYSQVGDLIENRLALESYVSTSNGTWGWSGEDVILYGTNTTLIGGVMLEKSETIATYAMCGFSAFSAIGISLGGLAALCPARRADVIKVLPAAFLGGNVASFLTGAVAGLLANNNS